MEGKVLGTKEPRNGTKRVSIIVNEASQGTRRDLDGSKTEDAGVNEVH
jgi:hypothetical protein